VFGMDASVTFGQQAVQSLSAELIIENDGASDVHIRILDAEVTPFRLLFDTTIVSQGEVLVNASGDIGQEDFLAQENKLYEVEVSGLDVLGTVQSWLWMDCNPSTVDISTHGFFCPNDEGANLHDLIVVVGAEDLKFSFTGVGPGLIEITGIFEDLNWIIPYNVQTICNAVSATTCDPKQIAYYFSPQISTQSLFFTSKDLVQPADRVWDFNNIDVTFPEGIDVPITEGLNIGGGTAHAFNADPGTVFRMGEHSRLTASSPITLLGTAPEPIRFEQLTSGKRWDYIDLTADGNTLQYVELDGADKTMEVRSTGNTFDNIMSTGGLRGVSSYFKSLPGGGTTMSGFDLTNSVIEGHQTVGVVAFHTNFTMSDVTVRQNGQDGVWLSSATSDSFTDNLVASNSLMSGVRSGIAVHSVSSLDMRTSAFNTIKNNAFHEITVSSTGKAYLGTSTGGSTGGKNTIFDTSTPAAGEFYVNNTSFAAVTAEYNCWNTTSAPAASLFNGSVDRDPFMSCSGLSKGGGEFTATPADRRDGTGDEIRAALMAFEASLEEAHLAAFYSLVVQPGAGGAAYKAELDRVLESVRTSSGRYAAATTRTKELATVFTLREALRAESHDEAVRFFAERGADITSPDFAVDFRLLAVLHGVTNVPKSRRDAAAEVAFLREELTYWAQEEKGMTLAMIDAELQHAALKKGADRTEGKAAVPRDTKLAIWPNPARGAAEMRFELEATSQVVIRAVDVLGREVLRQPRRALGAGSHTARLSLSGLAPGLYLIEIEVDADGGSRSYYRTTVTRN